MTNELLRMWQEVVVAWFEVLSWYLAGRNDSSFSSWVINSFRRNIGVCTYVIKAYITGLRVLVTLISGCSIWMCIVIFVMMAQRKSCHISGQKVQSKKTTKRWHICDRNTIHVVSVSVSVIRNTCTYYLFKSYCKMCRGHYRTLLQVMHSHTNSACRSHTQTYLR
jgi:hypothetical protein